MELQSARFLAGPNLHHRDSVLVVRCELGPLARLPLSAHSLPAIPPGAPVPDAFTETFKGVLKP